MKQKPKRKQARVSAAAAYPRPQLQRARWTSLDGEWEFALDPDARFTNPDAVRFNKKIRVPFSPETPASGVEDGALYKACWYRRAFNGPKLKGSDRLLLHFGAVDYHASVWVNGRLAVQHEGGYTPFSADITELLTPRGKQTIVVQAVDDPDDLAKPRGKQDWRREPHSIWYMRTTGIWQPVWLEVVPATRIQNLRWTPNVERWEISLEAQIAGPRREGLRLNVILRAGDKLLADDNYAVDSDEVTRRIVISDPGIDDYRNELLWSPHSPRLIDAQVRLIDENGRSVDDVSSYTAMRSISLLGNRFVLNGKPYPLFLVLDQGYWPQGGLTAPDDDAYRRDVELVKQMGFNGVRKHQKIENPRFLYWADKLGLFVWEEMPSAYRFSKQTIQRLTEQWTNAILRDISHPCIVAWVPINESWGVPDLPESPAQRHAIQALYHLTKTLDPSRPVIGNDGWEAAATDIVGIHDYDADPARMAQRYSHGDHSLDHLMRFERPGNKMLVLDGFAYQNQPIMLTEFGGIAFSDRAGTWGYSRARTADEFTRLYFKLLDTVRSLPLLAGFCYTQFTDTYQEANGLLYMDRTPKFPIKQIAVATRGAWTEDDRQLEATWRSHLRQSQRQQEDITQADRQLQPDR